jgi:hypothetical protein
MFCAFLIVIQPQRECAKLLHRRAENNFSFNETEEKDILKKESEESPFLNKKNKDVENDLLILSTALHILKISNEIVYESPFMQEKNVYLASNLQEHNNIKKKVLRRPLHPSVREAE